MFKGSKRLYKSSLLAVTLACVVSTAQCGWTDFCTGLAALIHDAWDDVVGKNEKLPIVSALEGTSDKLSQAAAALKAKYATFIQADYPDAMIDGYCGEGFCYWVNASLTSSGRYITDVHNLLQMSQFYIIEYGQQYLSWMTALIGEVEQEFLLLQQYEQSILQMQHIEQSSLYTQKLQQNVSLSASPMTPFPLIAADDSAAQSVEKPSQSQHVDKPVQPQEQPQQVVVSEPAFVSQGGSPVRDKKGAVIPQTAAKNFFCSSSGEPQLDRDGYAIDKHDESIVYLDRDEKPLASWDVVGKTFVRVDERGHKKALSEGVFEKFSSRSYGPIELPEGACWARYIYEDGNSHTFPVA